MSTIHYTKYKSPKYKLYTNYYITEEITNISTLTRITFPTEEVSSYVLLSWDVFHSKGVFLYLNSPPEHCRSGMTPPLTLIRPDTFTNTSGQMGSNLTPNIFWCSVTPLAVCFTIIKLLSIGNVIDHILALYLTFLDLIYFYFCGKITFKKIIKKSFFIKILFIFEMQTFNCYI